MLMRTTATRPFESLSPSQFEAVVRQVLGRLDGVEWETMPDPIGHLGSDDGQDIRATQLARGPKRVTRREWLVQVKRYEKIHPKDLEKIVDKAIPAGSKAPHALVVAVPCDATKRSFDAFRDRAKARGVKRPELWTREKLNDALNDPKNAKTASFYFGDGSAIPGTVPLPIALDRSGGRDAPLLGREDEVEALLGATGDILIVGPAGSGKSRLAAEIPGRRFLTLKAEADDVAESLRLDQPTHVVLDDAGLDLPRLDMLLELRQQGHEFAIIATTWAETADDVRARLSSAVRIDISLLERSEMDKTLKATGIGNYYLRGWILDLAEGRPGWAVGLADLAKGGRIPDVLSGRALIERIGPYLHRLNPAGGDRVMALLGVLAALGPLPESESGGVDAFLGIGRLERLALLREAAAVGTVELRGGALGVAPRALRPALMAHAFFDGTSRLPFGDLLAAFPNRTAEIVMRVIEAAHAGSTAARAEVDRLLPDLSVLFNWGGLATLEAFATIDDAAAQRAIRETEGLDASDEARRRVLTATTRQFLSAEAIGPLLSAAVGDSRQEHSAPDHPVRILGEIGRQVDPHGRTTFELRARVLAAANAWLEADPAPAHQEIWARVVAHQLDPHVDGVYSDSGSPMTIHLAYGFESEEHIRAIGDELWPDARARLPLLQTRPLVLLSSAVRELGEVVRGFLARADAVPSPEMSAAAAVVVDQIAADLTALARTRPGLQLALHRVRRDIGVGPRQPIDPEFRLLAMGWNSHLLRDDTKHLGHAVDRLVERWLAETPTTVMARVAQWGAEAALAGTDLEPVGSTAMHRYGERVGDLDAAVQAALDAGIRSEIGSLVRRAVTRATGEPAWLPQLFAGPQRWLGLSVALDPGVDSQVALRAATELRPDEARLAELSALRHSRDAQGSVDVLHALLTHPAPEVRAVAALAFPASGSGSPSTLPPDRYTEWKAAFLDAPLADPDNYHLGQHLNALATNDPELAASWVLAQVAGDAPLWRLGFVHELDLSSMPRANRDNLVRLTPDEKRGQVLQHLLGDERDWADDLLTGGVVSIGQVLSALMSDNRDGISAAEAIAWAPILMRHGAGPGDVLRLMDLGHSGPESNHHQRLRAALEAQPAPADPALEAFRQTGIARFAELEREAGEREREERITGRIH